MKPQRMESTGKNANMSSFGKGECRVRITVLPLPARRVYFIRFIFMYHPPQMQNTFEICSCFLVSILVPLSLKCWDSCQVPPHLPSAIAGPVPASELWIIGNSH